MPPRWSPALAFIMGIALPGAIAGRAVGIGLGQAAGEQPPPGWERLKPRPGYLSPVVPGELAPRADAWSLSRFGAIAAPTGTRSLDLEVELSPDGELLLVLDRSDPEAAAGPGVAIRRGGRPGGGVLVDPAAGERALSCEGAAGPSADGPTPLSLRIEPDGFTLESPAGTLRCPGDTGGSRITLVAGLGRLRLRDLVVDGAPVGSPAAPTALATLAGAAAAIGWASILRALGLGMGAVILSLLPLWLGLFLAGADAGPVYELARVPSQDGLRLAPALAAILPALALGLLGLGASAARRDRLRRVGATAIVATLLSAALVGGTAGGLPAPGLGLLCALLVGILPLGAARLLRRPEGPPPIGAVRAAALGALLGAALSMGADHGIARLYIALSGAALCGLGWVVRHALGLRFYNLLALALALSTLGALETGLRWTMLGRRWDGEDQREAGSSSTLAIQFAALEAGPGRGKYPAEAFPAALTPRKAPLRIACLGGSSTGGAWQNTDLSEFYPALLDELLGPDVEVVNQGTGSWTSFHMRHYVERWLPEADAGIVTLYLGVNEATLAPASYADLHQRWKAGRLQAGPSMLARLRLLNGLRYLARGLRGQGEVAVDPGDFRDNIEAIIEAVTGWGGRVLLVREVVYPSGEALSAWATEMEDAAEDRDEVDYLDPSARLLGLGGGGFLDQNHLSPVGHAALADEIASRLRAEGWVLPH